MVSEQKFSLSIQDKIFEIRYDSDNNISKIVSYFPFSKLEKHEIISTLNDPTFDRFHSIFSDVVSDEEWERTKNQIKQKFKDELFDIDKI